MSYFITQRAKHRSIGLTFLLQRQRIGPRRRRHAVERKRVTMVLAIYSLTSLGHLNPSLLGNHSGGLLASGHNGLDGGPQGKEAVQVDGFNYLQKLVAGIIFEAPHTHGRVVEGYALLGKKRLERRQIEAFLLLKPKTVFVAIEDEPHDAPHVVDFVWVIELHGPPLGLGWECAQHEHTGTLGQKWFKRMVLYLWVHCV